MTPMSNDPGAEARLRRKKIIQSQRSESQNETTSGSTVSISDVVLSSSVSMSVEIKNSTDQEANSVVIADATDNKPPKKRKVAVAVDSSSSSLRKNSSNKKGKCPDGEIDHSDENNLKKSQIRYDPEVPMSKDQLAAWRREARRVRNRESAAASRQRIRSRITELEEEVGDWKTKYNHAIQRLDALEKCVAVNTSGQQQEQPALASAASQQQQQQLAPPQPQQQQQQPETVSDGTISSTTTGAKIDV
eukprot:CAMPEP_0170784130 /NCGR_PEP_ID=MMETSP0733-20121128/15981_1 /TAXON_ID=186038 /ORGANISM="Fragilariopsis kerguelensis, Strain L26-C5" /LENGTH=246 /DNA_ID=CAMNT_0011129041 /DNA_START=105 /DNA_END=845 /DNA_ORIENTATION=+